MKLGVLGFPIQHSLSPKIFNYLASQYQKSVDYQLIEVPIEQFDFTTIKDKYDFVNITHPYKEKIMDFVEFDEISSLTKSVNLIDLKNLTGTNTDVDGFKTLLDYHSVNVKDLNILICGGGPSARSVIKAVSDLGVRHVQLKLRNIFKFENATKHFKVKYPDIQYSVIDDHTQFDIVINATPIGLSSEADASFFKNIFGNTKVAIDLNYKTDSIFLKTAETSSVEKRIDGFSMLVGQAIKSFENVFHMKIDKKTEIIYQLKGLLK